MICVLDQCHFRFRLSTACHADGLIAGVHDDGSVVFWSAASGVRLAEIADIRCVYQAVSMLPNNNNDQLCTFMAREGAIDVYRVHRS